MTTVSIGSGRWNYYPNEKVFSITINSLTGDASHIKNILWKSIVNADENMSSFSMAVSASSKSPKKVKALFYRSE